MSKKKQNRPKKAEEAPVEKKTPIGLFFLMAILVVVAVFAFSRKGDAPEAEKQQMTTTATPESAPPAMPQPSHDEPHASSDGHNDSDSQNFRMPPYFENPDLATLAPVLDPSTVAPAAQAAYAIAQKKPKLIAQLPCFCYCDRFGHKSLHDCYVTNHAQDCDICIKEVLEADMLDQQGMTSQEIREVIVARNHPRDGHSH